MLYLASLISICALSAMALRQHYGATDLLLFRTPWLCTLVSFLWLALYVFSAVIMFDGMGSMGSAYLTLTSLALPLIISSPYVLAAVPCMAEPFREANFELAEDSEALLAAQRLLDAGKRHEAHALLTAKVMQNDLDLALRRLLLPLQIELKQTTAIIKNVNTIFLHTTDRAEAESMIVTMKTYDPMLASKMEGALDKRFAQED